MINMYFLFALLSMTGQAGQTGKAVNPYPQGYFRDPLNIPIMLAGNFGECRPGHFHSGIDIKTNGVENLPVFAAADGYVSRIKMDKDGFGHAIYITHPNGYTTLYAHLNDFVPQLQRQLKKQQYEKKLWAVDFTMGPEEFPVKQGDQIAWSGNTGGSTAPHLHFEIRDTRSEHPLNPELFGLDIHDTKPPVPTAIALYDLSKSVYDQTPEIIGLKKHSDAYVSAKDTITVDCGRLGIGVDINDFMDGSENTLAFYTASWEIDGRVQGRIRLDDIGYDVTRYLNAYADYKTKQQKGAWFQSLFQLPGNKLDVVYEGLNACRGALTFEDALVHAVTIVFTDDAGNSSRVELHIRKANSEEGQEACKYGFKAAEANQFEDLNLRLDFKAAAFYDNFCFRFSKRPYEKAFSPRFLVHNPDVPVHNYFDLSIKPDKPIPFKLRDKVILMYSDGKSESGRAASYKDGWYVAQSRSLGDFWLQADTTAPVIVPAAKNNADLRKAAVLSFTVREDLTSVRSFSAELDGKWLCFEPRGERFFYRFDEHCPPGKHTLVVRAADESGNTRSLKYNFTR